MKKLSVIMMALVSVFSCHKKENQAENPTENQAKNSTENTTSVADDTLVENAQIQAITSDEQGVFTQKFILEKGKTYPFTTSQKDVVKLTAPTGESQSITNESTDEVSFTIDDIKDNIYEISINFVSKKTAQSSNGKSAVVDTKTAAPKDEGLKNKWTIDKALVGNQLKMRMETTGKILSITGFDAIYTKISNAIGSLTKDANIKKELLAQTKAGFNENALKEQFTKNIMILPTKGVKLGEKWSKSENISPDGKVKLTTNYTLKSIENGIITIAVSGGIPKQSEKETQNGITHSMSSDLNQVGTISFDQNSGWIINQNINVKTTQTETMSDGKQSQSMTSVTQTSVSVNP